MNSCCFWTFSKFCASTLDGSFVSGCLDVVFDGLLSFDVSLGDSLLAGSSDGLVLSGFSTSLGLLSDGCSGVDSLGYIYVEEYRLFCLKWIIF